MSGRLTANNVGFYFDYKNGEYGWNSSSSRGADTFTPFKKGGASKVHTFTITHPATDANYVSRTIYNVLNATTLVSGNVSTGQYGGRPINFGGTYDEITYSPVYKNINSNGQVWMCDLYVSITYKNQTIEKLIKAGNISNPYSYTASIIILDNNLNVY